MGGDSDQHFELHSFLLETELELAKYCQIPAARDIKSELKLLLASFLF